MGLSLELILAAIAAIGTLGGILWGRRSGRKDAEARQAQDTLDGVQRGTQGAARARRELDEGKTPDQKLRDNDGHWK